MLFATLFICLHHDLILCVWCVLSTVDVSVLHVAVPAVVPLNLSQPPVRPQRNIVSVSPVTASAALPKAGELLKGNIVTNEDFAIYLVK